MCLCFGTPVRFLFKSKRDNDWEKGSARKDNVSGKGKLVCVLTECRCPESCENAASALSMKCSSAETA